MLGLSSAFMLVMEAHSAHPQQTPITPNRSDTVPNRPFLSVAVLLWAYHKSFSVSMFGFESFSGRGSIENHSALPDSCRQTFEVRYPAFTVKI